MINNLNTCFTTYKNLNKNCDKSNCKHWIDCKKDNNCVLISADNGPKTLQEVGEIFGITRMRVCQIEKSILKKIKPEIDKTII